MLYQISNDRLSVTACSKGAELWSIRDRRDREYLWQGDGRFWGDRGPHLFPYIARLTDKSYYLDGKLYHMDIHGLAPYREFTLLKNSGGEMLLELTDTPDTLSHYPRAFSFRVGYLLSGSQLSVTYEVENRDSRSMYFGLGGHPGFQVPIAPGRAFTDYRLRFSQPCRPARVGFTPACFLDGTEAPFPLVEDRFLPLRHDLFDDDAIVLKHTAPAVTIEAEDAPERITVSFPQTPYLGLWHAPKTQAPYLCIEPWSSLPSRQDEIAVLEEQEDLLSLQPGRTFHGGWSVTIE